MYSYYYFLYLVKLQSKRGIQIHINFTLLTRFMSH